MRKVRFRAVKSISHSQGSFGAHSGPSRDDLQASSSPTAASREVGLQRPLTSKPVKLIALEGSPHRPLSLVNNSKPYKSALGLQMETPDPLLERISLVLAAVPGVAAIVVGGSRASGAAHPASDTDIGLYFGERAGLDVGALLEAVKGLVDDRAPRRSRRSAAGARGSSAAAGSRSPARRWTSSIGRSSGSRKSFRTAGTGASAWIISRGIPMASARRSQMGEVALCRPLSRSSRRYRYRLVMRSVAGGDASRRTLQSAPAPRLLDHPSTRDASHRGSG